MRADSPFRGGDRGGASTAAKGIMPAAAVLVHRFYMRRSLKDFGEKVCSFGAIIAVTDRS